MRPNGDDGYYDATETDDFSVHWAVRSSSSEGQLDINGTSGCVPHSTDRRTIGGKRGHTEEIKEEAKEATEKEKKERLHRER